MSQTRRVSSVRLTSPISPAGHPTQKGFSLLELLIVVAIIGLLTAIAIPGLRSAIVKAHISAVAADCRTLYNAFSQYHIDHQKFPNASTAPKFDLVSFEPLRREGYYRGRVVEKLEGGSADAYDSPDKAGDNAEYWIEMTLKIDNSIRFLVANSDEAPLAGGRMMDGIFMYKNGVLTPITK